HLRAPVRGRESHLLPTRLRRALLRGRWVATPLPTTVPDNGLSISNVSCAGTALTLTGTTPAEAGGNTCSGGSNHHNSCTTNADCPGGTCSFLHCTNAGCLFGPPLPVPNGSHASA